MNEIVEVSVELDKLYTARARIESLRGVRFNDKQTDKILSALDYEIFELTCKVKDVLDPYGDF